MSTRRTRGITVKRDSEILSNETKSELCTRSGRSCNAGSYHKAEALESPFSADTECEYDDNLRPFPAWAWTPQGINTRADTPSTPP